MTDYLELLLEQLEDDGNEQPLDWKRTTRSLSAVKGDKQEDAGKRSLGAAAERVPLQTRNRTETGMTETPEKMKIDILEQLDRLGRTATKVKNGGAGVWGSRQSAEVTSVMPVGFEALSDKRMSASTSAARLAAALDAAFERDARRYDGPLGLL